MYVLDTVFDISAQVYLNICTTLFMHVNLKPSKGIPLLFFFTDDSNSYISFHIIYI